MKLSLIPPHCYMHHIGITDYHLFLPQLFRNEDYCRAALKVAIGTDDYCILDNGAAEGEEWHPDALHTIADQFGIDEIVIPDILGNKDHTVAAAYKFAEFASGNYKYMAVLQGQSYEELVDCAEHFAEMPYVHTIGIPRHLAKTLGDRDARLVITGVLIDKFGERFEYHLLGATPLWSRELLFAQVAYGEKLRGMDTSMPYNYAYYGESVDGEMTMLRPSGYFELPEEKFHEEHVMDNVAKMLSWANHAQEYVSDFE